MESVQIGKRGWLIVKPASIVFPERCAECGLRTPNRWGIRAERLDWLTAVCTLGMIYHNEFVDLQIPICETCPVASRRRGQLVTAVLGALVGTAIGGFFYVANPDALIMIPILLVACTIGGFFFGREHSYRPPVQVKSYSPKNGTVMLRIQNPDYAEQFLAANGVVVPPS